MLVILTYLFSSCSLCCETKNFDTDYSGATFVKLFFIFTLSSLLAIHIFNHNCICFCNFVFLFLIFCFRFYFSCFSNALLLQFTTFPKCHKLFDNYNNSKNKRVALTEHENSININTHTHVQVAWRLWC